MFLIFVNQDEAIQNEVDVVEVGPTKLSFKASAAVPYFDTLTYIQLHRHCYGQLMTMLQSDDCGTSYFAKDSLSLLMICSLKGPNLNDPPSASGGTVHSASLGKSEIDVVHGEGTCFN